MAGLAPRAGAAAPRHHLLAVWNPTYASDAMEAHLGVLLDLARRHDAHELDDDELYVWWGKVRSSNRLQALPHLDDVLALAPRIGEEDDDDPPELHLYLTDYQSLYVADIADITTTDVSGDAAHVPAYYRADGRSCDCWFRLRDIRLIVANDMRGVSAELRHLRNVRYHDKPVSLYGGMVELPLIVTRDEARRFFDPDERERLTDGALWAEWDAERQGGVGEMERELRENRFGDALWQALDFATRRFLATAERTFRDHHADAAFDFAPVLASFAKALEVQCNLVLARAARRMSDGERRAHLGDRTVDVACCRALGLGELARVIGGERELDLALQRLLENGAWFAGSLPAIVEAFREVRNDGVHASRVDRETASRWRNQLIGVGCEGEFVKLAKVKLKDRRGR